MRSSSLYVSLVVSGVLLGAGSVSVVRADDNPVLVSESAGQVEVWVEPAPAGSSFLFKRRFFVAIPDGADARAERLGGSYVTRPALPDEIASLDSGTGAPAPPSRAGWFPLQPVVVVGPFTYRNTRVLAVECYLQQLDPATMNVRDWSGYHVVVRYPPPKSTLKRNRVDPFVADIVVNRDLFPAPAGAAARSAGQAGADPQFSKSQNWVELEVDTRGVYAVSGADLAEEVPLSDVGDPSTFRIFTGSGFEQKRDLADPEASWRPGNWMREIAIYVEGEGDGVFDVGDRILFYAVGAEGWMDHFDPSAPDTVYYTHGRATKNYYYLTWESDFAGQPSRMVDVDASPSAGAELTTFSERLHLEKNRVSDYDYGGDFWLWEKIPRDDRKDHRVVLDRVNIWDLVTSVPQVFRTVALAPYTGKQEVTADGDTIPYDTGHHAAYDNTPPGASTPTRIGDYRWNASTSEYSYEDGRPVRFTGNFLAPGSNRLDLVLPRDDNKKDWMYFAWLSLTYERRLNALGNRLGFDSPDSTGSVNFRVTGFGSAGNVHAFDVTDRFNVRRLTGLDVAAAGGGTRRLRFSATLSGGRAHLWTASDDGLLHVPSIRQMDVTDLRNVATAPRMLIVIPRLPSFLGAAERLASYRRNNLARFGSGTVSVVTTEDIYENFSGGQPDPFAVRNYIKFLYELDAGGTPTLAYVLLLGDANMDYKNHASSAVDRVPTFLIDLPARYDETFATDELYAHMDVADQTPGCGAGDIGIGRLPAASASEADLLVDKVIAYESEAPFGDWRSQVVLVADDESPSGGCESWFTNGSEILAELYQPQYVDVRKVYLDDYPSLAGPKPASRRDLLAMWNEGAVIIHYVGHGSSLQLADEIVFVNDDVPKLNNGLRLPIFMALSCTVGDFAHPSKKSLSEDLLLKSGGGAIGTVTASALSQVYANENLSKGMFDHLLPRRPGDPVALGEDMMRAKLEALLGPDSPDTIGCGSDYQEENNWKYNLLSDPSLRIKAPHREVQLNPDAPDTLVAGVRKTIRGRVMKDGAVDAGFNGSVTVRMHEPDVFKLSPRCGLGYYLRGGIIYRGMTDVVDGQFSVNFRVPRYAKPGRRAFFTAYADDGATDAGMSYDSTFSLSLPTQADSLALTPVDGAPRVLFGFKSGLKVVKPGESLQAVIRDQDGVNILNTTNEGRHALLIDDSPVPFDVTRFFEFDYGGTDTSGVLTYPLPELPVGNHRAILRVADSFAQTTLDTLEFSVTDPLDYYADVVLNYPNPFATSTQFLIRLSNRASIRLDIFTVSGKRIRRLEAVRNGGEEWILWDGRDQTGDEIANGTYLYVATVDFEGIDRAPLVIRGKLTKIQ